MKMSTAFRRGRAEHRRKVRNIPKMYDDCPVCRECLERLEYQGRCIICPVKVSALRTMGWHKMDATHGKDCAHCYALFEAEAHGDPLAGLILDEVILNLVAQGD